MTTPAASRKNRYGSRVYPVPKPGTLEIVELPSVTSILNVLAKPSLETWKMRTLAQTLSVRSDLVILAGTGVEGAKTAVKQAMDSNTAKANRGTGLHYFTEQVDDGSLIWDLVPEPAKPAVAAYAQAKEDFGWELVRKEFSCFSHQHGYAGTADRFLRLPSYGPGTYTGDVKTGSGIYADHGLQMGFYTFSEGIWEPPTETPGADAAMATLAEDIKNGTNVPPNRRGWSQAAIKAAEADIQEQYWTEYARTGRFVELPEDLSQDVAFVLHLSDDKCDVVPLTITSLKASVAGVAAAYRFQNMKNIVGQPLTSGRTPTSAPPAPDQALGGEESLGATNIPPQEIVRTPQEPAHPNCGVPDRDPIAFQPEPPKTLPVAAQPSAATRVQIYRQRIIALPVEAKRRLAFAWPAGVPTFKQSTEQTDAQLGLIDALLWQVECEFNVTPFGVVDSAKAEVQAVQRVANAFAGSTIA